MLFLYRFLYPLLWVLSMPRCLFRRLRRGGYGRRGWQRWGFYEKSLAEKSSGKRRIWFQAVSVGELKAIDPLLRRLAKNPRLEVFLSVSSSSAHRLVERDYAPGLLDYAWFPWDFFPIMASAWAHIRPDLAILSEEELWPEFLAQAERHKVPVFLINGRLSERTCRRYRHLPFWTRWLWRHLSWIALPSPAEMEKFKNLGAPEALLTVVGNLKGDRPPPSTDPGERLRLRQELGFAPKDLVLIGLSTWPGEEALLLECLERLRRAEPALPLRLLLVPRHAERRGEIAKLLRSSSFSWHRRSEGPGPAGTDVGLVDTTGELEQLARAGDVAFIGKSWGSHRGGQNPLDAAFAGLPMVYGPHLDNFRTLSTALEAEEVAWGVRDREELLEKLRCLLKNPSLRREIAARLRGWAARQAGATEKVFRKILRHFALEKES
ncbi:MAG: glycosyltransferase [Puniceicoccales bacterium]|jgi:3-deoxy-D-manno-octulosonic-acid transferase|nr:glycosyltransferase [Puniceicoccales bacterium]